MSGSVEADIVQLRAENQRLREELDFFQSSKAYGSAVEHLRAEIARCHEEVEQTRRVLDTAPLLLWSRSPDGHLTFCNERCAEYTGLTREELLSEGWQEKIHPDDLERVRHQTGKGPRLGNQFRIGAPGAQS